MIHFATTCIDNFFKYPDSLVNYANSLEFTTLSWEGGEQVWPGKRSKELHILHPALYDDISKKYLYNHYTLRDKDTSVSYHSQMHFQKVDSEYDKGWIHLDDGIVHTTIIYLTPDANPAGGTSLYVPKKGIDPLVEPPNDYMKRKFYADEEKALEADKHRLEWKNNFEEVTRFSNVYNRCIGFDGSQWHGSNNLSSKGERLTLVIFWQEITGPQTGLQRSQMELI
tara:strand:+ start:1181 stop:1855 length:675 start_codon:yes stop_codon:yes gene_type:complete